MDRARCKSDEVLANNNAKYAGSFLTACMKACAIEISLRSNTARSLFASHSVKGSQLSVTLHEGTGAQFIGTSLHSDHSSHVQPSHSSTASMLVTKIKALSTMHQAITNICRRQPLAIHSQAVEQQSSHPKQSYRSG